MNRISQNIKKIIGLVVFLTSIYLFFYFKYNDTAFILVYHQIGDYKGGLKSLYVKKDTFNRQMNFLYNRGYKSITLSELRYRIENNLPLKKVFCITFDDGYRSLEDAYYILKKYNFKATAYLHIKAILNGVYSYPNMPPADMISLEKVKKMLDVFELGSHTINHPDLTKISYEEVLYEIKESKKFLEEMLNVKVNHFCYPFGKYFKNHKEILSKEGYLTATTLNAALIEKKNVDFFFLPRVEWKEWSYMSFDDFFKNFEFYIKIFLGL